MAEQNGWQKEYLVNLHTQVQEMEDRVRSLEGFRDKFSGGILVLSTFGGLLGSAITVMVQWLISRLSH